MKFIVSALPSLRPREVAVEGGDDACSVAVLAATSIALPLADAGAAGVGEHRAADRLEASAIWPSRSMVARTCSEPGVTRSGVGILSAVRLGLLRRRRRRGSCPRTTSWCSCRSRAAEIWPGSPPSSTASAASFEIGRARSGVCGPTIVRLERRQVDLDRPGRSTCSGSASTSGSAPARCAAAASASSASAARPVRAQIARHPLVEGEDRGGRAELRAHVAIVALPVALIVRAPGPKYSTIALVPPVTVRMPQRLRGSRPSARSSRSSSPVSLTPMSFG